MNREQIISWVMPGLIVIVIFFLPLGYAIYSVGTATGIGGWLVDLQLQRFGKSHTKLTILVATVMLGAGGFVVVLLIGYLVDLFGGKQAAHKTVVKPLTAPVTAQEQKQSTAGIWAGVAVLVGSLVIGGGAYLWLSWVHEGERGSEFELVRIEAGTPAPEPRTRFVALDAVAQTRFIYSLEHKQRSGSVSTDHYVPLTGPDWTPGMPVRFVLILRRSRKLTRADVSAPFYVMTERDGLPQYVLTEYQKVGFALASPYYAVLPAPVENGRVGSREREDASYLFLMWIGSGIGLFIVISGFAVNRSRRAKARQAAADEPIHLARSPASRTTFDSVSISRAQDPVVFR